MADKFAELVKDIQREITDLKSARKRSSLTLRTQTKSVTLTCRVERSGNYYFLVKAGLAKLTFNTDAPQIFCAVAGAQADRGGRGLTFYNYNDGDGAVMVEPATGAQFDSGMADGSTKDFTVKIFITATADFTVTASQIDF